MKYLVQLIEIKKDQILKNSKGEDVKYDVYTFDRVIKTSNGTFKGTKDNTKDKWFNQENSDYAYLQPSLVDGNYFYVTLNWNGKIETVETYTAETNIDLQNEFIDKYTR